MKTISFRNDILPLKNVLYRLALRITLSHEDAEDVVQDTLMKVWSRRNEWQQIDNIEAYALTAARNIALDKMKRAGVNVTSPLSTLTSTPVENTTQLEERIIEQDRLQFVRNLIDQLPEKQRSCMQLRDVEEKSYKEIAQILNISEEQVKVNIFRARQSIKQKFKEADEYGL
ncbi:MAG: RNA polymerase sigma factor [Prevotella sp.]|nr:RNA polymerase sigma factor [Prevotella sp.]